MKTPLHLYRQVMGKFSTYLIAITLIGLMAFKFLSVGERVDFNTEVKPLINKHCIACHGGVKQASNYSLLFRNEALGKAKSGKNPILPHDADHSEFYKRIISKDEDDRMPKGKEALKPEEIEIFKKWIDQGANFEDHWAYIKPQLPDVPAIGNFLSRLGLMNDAETSWTKNDIDHFIINDLKQQKLTFSTEADKATLLRRVSLDLTGLPPQQADLEAFMKDNATNAYEKAVDKLLASPTYGERWAAMWLDLARYADSKGYERDVARKIYLYRDYVIKSFNQDKAFDRFTVEQLAGDLLPNPSDEQLIATGFHRNTMNNDEGGTVDEEFRTAAVIDRINTTWDVWQGTTFSCVQCHSHPYDPFKHEEYYKFMAFFNNTRDEDVVSETPTLRFYKPEDSTKIVELSNWIKQNADGNSLQYFNKFVKCLEPKHNSHELQGITLGNTSLLDAKYFGFQDKGEAILKNIDLTNKNRLVIAYGTNAEKSVLEIHDKDKNGKILLKFPAVKTGNAWKDSVMIYELPIESGLHDLYFMFSAKKQPKEWLMIKWASFQKSLTTPQSTDNQSFTQKYQAILNLKPKNETPIFVEGSEDLNRKTYVFERGNWLVHGKEVQPDVPNSFPKMPSNFPKNRLGLAMWLTSPDNPLTARVAVNRFWEQLFGIGIVETVEDFGTQGFAPTHPELLDYLAIKFQSEYKWSIKKLLKFMVMSATYRQNSAVSKELVEKDPNNIFLARGPRLRMTAEQVHDQALCVSGLLSNKMYGSPVMPYQPDGYWASPYNGENWKLSTGEDKHRRAIYTYLKRTAPYPSMLAFDSPSREFCQLRRIRTNTPLQALVTLNDPVFVESAQKLAEKATGNTVEQKIQQGYNLLLAQNIDANKLQILKKLYSDTEKYYKQNPNEARKFYGRSDATPEKAALAVTFNAMLNLDECVTKQ